jgi:RimJ/RimL family protein N-acetyltransferase
VQLFEGTTKKGNTFYMRYPLPSDAEQYLHFINTLSQEETFITQQGEQWTLEQEKEYLTFLLQKINDKRRVVLFAFINNQLVGNVSITMMDNVEKHVGDLTIEVSKEYRGEGIGTTLMELVLKEVKEQIPQIQMVTLGLFGNNDIAFSMYKKMGFEEYGRLPKGIVHKDSFVDHILMYKMLDKE